MKRTALLLTVMLMTAMAWAAKANQQPTVVTQSDGTQLTVILYGDEDFHYYATTDGVILYSLDRSYYVANIASDGTLTATSQLAHEPSQRSDDETALITAQDRNTFLSTGTQKSQTAKVKRESLAYNSTLLSHEGSPKVVVILAQFSDVEFTVNEPYEAFYQYLNGDEIEDKGNYNSYNYGSVRSYFKDMSFGNFTPQFDVYGPVTLNNELSYYGDGDDYMSRFIPDVCKAMDDSLDFSSYDENGDGYVDLLYVIYAGYSESIGGNSTDCIWPKSGTVSGGTYDGVTVYRYGVNNELNLTDEYTLSDGSPYINGIGLFCHEFSHCLGLPDLYVTSGTSTAYLDNQEMEYWSVMDSGTYLYNGYSPAAYTAWEREYLGWFALDTLSSACQVELSTIDNGGTAYRILNDSDATGHEYYIVENIQQEGWNAHQYGHGMLAIHVDYDANAFSLSSNSVNNTAGHPRMTVLAADGTLDNIYSLSTTSEAMASYGGDPFPGTSNVTCLTDTSAVYPIVYNGSALAKPIYNIVEDEETGVVTFAFLETNDSESTGIMSIPASQYASDAIDNRIYTIDGRYVGTSTEGLKRGIYISGSKKIIVGE